MVKLLKITKPSGQISYLPDNNYNKAHYLGHNSKHENAEHLHVKIEHIEVDEKNIPTLPDMDEAYKVMAPKDAQELALKNEELLKRIAELEAAQKESAQKESAQKEKEEGKTDWRELVAKIKSAATVDEVNQLSNGDERSSIVKATQERIAELEA